MRQNRIVLPLLHVCAYNPFTDKPSPDEVARATKALILGLMMGATMALLSRARRSHGERP
jgi:hypothetical protein